MKLFNLSIRAVVFCIAMLLGTSAVIATHFVFKKIVAALKPEVVAEHLASKVETDGIVMIEETDSSAHQKGEDFDPTGDYTLDIEKVPKEFSDIESLGVRTREYLDDGNGTYTNRPIVPKGTLVTKKNFPLSKIAIGNREISFKTETIGGIRYEFVGQFYNYSEIIECDTCEYPAPLAGKLRKIKNGKVVADLDVKFYAVDNC